MLDVQDIHFAYRNRAILNDIAFDLKPGRILVILGPNGVGKTTLLKCLNAIQKPKAGSVLLDSENLLSLTPPQLAAKVGYVAQKSQTARLTVFDAVLMGRKPHMGWRVKDHDLAIVGETIARLGLEALSLRYLDELSGGELQKVSIARAFVQQPRLLLLDEPTSALDMRNQFELLSLLFSVVRERKTATVVTMHDLNTALRFADEFLLLKDGRVLARGAVEEISPKLIEATYDIPVSIHTIDGAPVVVPKPTETPTATRPTILAE
ncbi:iron complex transport system ATP-binding protein [Cohaesibacter marisflavi]|uniref:Iron complex transport system ATP-binding protein n=1 Tax=Cohaesibacter marisflavi TaxID=655353 RepID=A0A1I5F1T4_9HYPH|nr:ABC transporter ATP-binding protein [Cohaesibacter marisflavi]SFO17281.1 iron complex transport system ATP-binding protein [Cohaesibacter marisflavi]